MSAYVNEKGEFVDFYGTTILLKIKNVDDFQPLLISLQKIKDIKLVTNLHLRLFDIFSQTMSSFTGEKCKKIEEWYKNNGGKYYPYSHMNYDVILETHYEAKNFLNKLMPTDFCIKHNIELKIHNNKLVLKFKFSERHINSIKSIVATLNDLYGIKRNIPRYITIGYVTNAPLDISPDQLKMLNNLVPNKIIFDNPDVYKYSSMDKYHLYSYNMF